MKKIAVIEGGYSLEKAVSLKSSNTIFENLDRSKFIPTKVLIDKKEWVAYDNDGKYFIDKNDFSFIKNGIKHNFDFAFIIIHGSPGEDGKLQGYFEMIGIPHSTSSSAITSLTFQKFHCNQFLKNFDVNVAEAFLLRLEDKIDETDILNKIGLPCFVKPTNAGSSFGITKVKSLKELTPAIKYAFSYGNEIVIEANIKGREVTNGIFRNKEGLKTLPITEIISENEYFDYEAKYNGKSKEITPAEINEEQTQNIKSLTYFIYKTLGMNGLVRMDYIVNENNIPFLIEINTVPGMSKESIIPQMIKEDNKLIKDVLSDIINLKF
jgi:D-alanine-D-alanine ligase